MDDSTLYDKTAAGEEAVRERTRLIQRNLRIVLIIVDGQTDVAEIKRKVGDSLLVESSLAELQAMGLIVPAREGTTTAEAPPVQPPPPVMVVAPEPEPGPEPHPIEVEPPKPVELPPPSAEKKPSFLARLDERWQERQQKIQINREEAAFERAFADEDEEEEEDSEPVGKVLPLLPANLAAMADFRHLPPPTSRAGKPLKKLAIAALVLLLATPLGLLLYPYDMYRADIEQRLSAALQDTVKIGKVDVSFAPLPYITLHEVAVGAEPYATATAVRLLPEFGSLFDDRKILREVRVAGLNLLDRAIVPVGRWFPADPAGRLTIRRLTFDDVSWTLGALRGEGWSGEAQLGDQGELTGIQLHNADGKGRAEFKPAREGLQVHLTFSDWTPPFREQLQFASLAMDGLAAPQGLRFDKIDGSAIDGRLEGSGALAWDNGLALSAQLAFRHMEMSGLMAALGSTSVIVGPVSGNLKLLSRGGSVGRLFDQLSAAGTFEASAGTLKHLGLVESLQGSNRTGSTRFEKLAGEFSVGPGGTRLEKLQLTSGALRAGGRLELSTKGELGGRLDVELHGSGGIQRASLAVGGTAAEPTLGTRR
jgi:hypothetical protein